MNQPHRLRPGQKGSLPSAPFRLRFLEALNLLVLYLLGISLCRIPKRAARGFSTAEFLSGQTKKSKDRIYCLVEQSFAVISTFYRKQHPMADDLPRMEINSDGS